MKYRCMLGDRFIDVEAENEQEAQEQAFARHIRSLTPVDFQVWPTGKDDDWRDERS